MLKIIKPEHQCYYKARVDLFMGLVSLYQDVSLTPEEQAQAVFIIGEDEEYGVYGGAVLQKRYVDELQSPLQSIVSTLTPQREEIWVGTLSCFIEETMPISPTREDCHRLFYKNLFEKFVEFGGIEDTGYLCLTLNPFEHLRTKNRGFWPYIIEVKPQDSRDGYFHGILPLSPQKDSFYNPVRPTFPAHTPSYSKLAA